MESNGREREKSKEIWEREQKRLSKSCAKDLVQNPETLDPMLRSTRM
jgi:hypothetical protein